MYAQLYAQMYDGNNYVMTQIDVMWWVWFLTIVVVLTFALLCFYLYVTYRACQTTRPDAEVRVASPGPVEGALDGDVARSGGERELAHAGSGPGDASG